MLKDIDSFRIIEGYLRDNGTIEEFEKDNGLIRGRLMITDGDIPDNLETDPLGEDDHVFIGTYDFYDMEIGIVLNTRLREAKTGVWLTPQCENASEPAREWIDFFIQKLIQGLNEDGSFAVPMYTFISDYADFTVVPSM